MTVYTIPCTRCDGDGYFKGFGNCFKCGGTRINRVTENQYNQYHTKKENATAHVLFNLASGEVKPLLEVEAKYLTFESLTLPLNGASVVLSKVNIEGKKFIAVDWGRDWRGVLTKLTIMLNAKNGVKLTEEEALAKVESYLN